MVISALEGVKWAESATKAALLSALGVPHGFERGQSGAEPQHHRQVHGVTILEAHPERSAPGLAARAAADGIFSQKVGERIAVKTADCVPVLIGDRGRRLVMAVHAGWRGLTQGILPEAVALAAARGIPPADLVLAIGPAIGREAFEVGPEVVAALGAPAARLSEPQAALATAKGRGDRWHVDLALAAVLQARNAGVPAAQIEVLAACTFTEAGNWHSYRRERAAHGQLTGSNWSWIEL